MMKRTLEIAVLLTLVAGFAMAGAITVDFSQVGIPQNITVTGTNPPYTVDSVSFGYYPQTAATVPVCGFDAGLGGFGFGQSATFPLGCVGAQVDTSGLTGTTEGLYSLGFADSQNRLNFSYGLFTYPGVDVPPDQPSGVAVLFYASGNLVDVATSAGAQGNLTYSGQFFDRADVQFTPFEASVTDPTTLVTQPLYGQTLVAISGVTTTPEPGSIAFLLIGLAAMGCGMVRRRK
jgi:hypothetical protein